MESQKFLNQTRAGHRPVRAWFLRIASVRECLCVCVCLHVCVSTPEAMNTLWRDVAGYRPHMIG